MREDQVECLSLKKCSSSETCTNSLLDSPMNQQGKKSKLGDSKKIGSTSLPNRPDRFS
jgi:hypothetical protein